MKMEQCSETSAYKIQTPGNYPKESMQNNYCLYLNPSVSVSELNSEINVKTGVHQCVIFDFIVLQSTTKLMYDKVLKLYIIHKVCCALTDNKIKYYILKLAQRYGIH
jgi:hypothetical protein